MAEKTEFDFLTNEQLLEEIKRLWREDRQFELEWEEEIRHRGYRTAADDYVGDDAERHIERAQNAYKDRGLELPDRWQYIAELETKEAETDIELCENCGQNPGILNSSFWKEDDDDEGHWVCEPCEQELAEEHEVWARSMASVYAGAYEDSDRPGTGDDGEE